MTTQDKFVESLRSIKDFTAEEQELARACATTIASPLASPAAREAAVADGKRLLQGRLNRINATINQLKGELMTVGADTAVKALVKAPLLPLARAKPAALEDSPLPIPRDWVNVNEEFLASEEARERYRISRPGAPRVTMTASEVARLAPANLKPNPSGGPTFALNMDAFGPSGMTDHHRQRLKDVLGDVTRSGDMVVGGIKGQDLADLVREFPKGSILMDGKAISQEQSQVLDKYMARPAYERPDDVHESDPRQGAILDLAARSVTTNDKISEQDKHAYSRAFETPPAKPINRDSVWAGLGRMVVHSAYSRDPKLLDFISAHIEAVLPAGEWFDFGRIEEDALSSAATDAQPFGEANLINLPYPETIMRLRALKGTLLDNDVELLLLLRQTEMGAPITVVSLVFGGPAGEWVTVFQTGHMERGQFTDLDGSARQSSKSTTLLFNALWLIINAKGVDKTRTEPDAKLNKARAKSGKRPLLPVTRVAADQYITALGETVRREKGDHQGGSHASPRPHLRRAHLRKYYGGELLPMEDWVPVQATIVNGSDDLKVAARKSYVVKKGKA